MFGKFFKYLFCGVLALLSFAPVQAEDFPKFLVNFFYAPNTQSSKTQYPLRINQSTVASSAAYKPIGYRNRNQIAVVCVDSIESMSAGNSPKRVSLLNTANHTGMNYSFSSVKSHWKLTAGSKAAGSATDADFLTFLHEYSTNNDFQMKRTIFPLPYRYSKNPNNPKLMMPREWTYLNLTSMFPQVLVSSNTNSATNRRIYVYSAARLSMIYNFIQINKKWFLIEIENYR